LAITERKVGPGNKNSQKPSSKRTAQNYEEGDQRKNTIKVIETGSEGRIRRASGRHNRDLGLCLEGSWGGRSGANSDLQLVQGVGRVALTFGRGGGRKKRTGITAELDLR